MAKVFSREFVIFGIVGGVLLMVGFLLGQGSTPKEPVPQVTPTIEPSPTSVESPTPQPSPEVKSATPPPQEIQLPPPQTGGYACDCSKKCSQMSSCEEAYYQLNTCGCSRRDGDKDGVPCENICPGG